MLPPEKTPLSNEPTRRGLLGGLLATVAGLLAAKGQAPAQPAVPAPPVAPALESSAAAYRYDTGGTTFAHWQAHGPTTTLSCCDPGCSSPSSGDLGYRADDTAGLPPSDPPAKETSADHKSEEGTA